MKAGRELDALIAEKVMAWQNLACLNGGNVPTGEPDDDWNRDARADPAHGHTGIPQVHRESVPEYSTDILAAWLVVDKMRELGFKKRELWSMYHGTWMAEFDRYQPGNSDSEPSEADTAPLAICLAALQALTHAPAEGG